MLVTERRTKDIRDKALVFVRTFANSLRMRTFEGCAMLTKRQFVAFMVYREAYEWNEAAM